ncbi:MAG: PLP-dependent aminotransferase family protein [Comamonas sp.]
MQTAALHDWLNQELQRNPPQGLTRQPGAVLLSLIRRAILDNVLVAGERIPSSRELARELDVARNTVVDVYEQLKSEGMLVAGQGAGTFVCPVLRGPRPYTRASTPGDAALRPARGERPLRLSRRGQAYQSHPIHRFWAPQAFGSGRVDLSLFPLATWNRLQRRHIAQASACYLESGEEGGSLDLRSAIASHLRTARGVRCQAEQVILTDGTVESLELIARLMTDPGDIALTENPCYWGAGHVLSGHGLSMRALDVDGQGLPLPTPEQLPQPPRLVYLTPSHQFPMGHVMTLPRRMEWLRYAEQHDAILLEDDYDSEYRYEGKPFPSLQGMHETDRVMYMGTFSKSLYPGIRMAYLVVPESLRAVFATASSDFYRDGDMVLQRTLADFIREGHYAAHIRVTRREYAVRREALRTALLAELSVEFEQGLMTLSGGTMGMHMTLLLPLWADDQTIAQAAAALGVTLVPLSIYCVSTRHSGLLLSYAAVPCDQIAAKVAIIAPVIRQALACQPRSTKAM